MKLSEFPIGVLQSALRVTELPLRVHPLIGKRPLLDDWPAKATADQREVERWLRGGRNYGIVCDAVAVIDTDDPALAAWWRRNMPKTPWTVRTPRGGTHFFYRSVPGLRNAVKAHCGWDVRAGGNGYVVGFCSVVDGRAYELLGEATLDLPPFDPAWLPPIRAEPVQEPSIVLPRRGHIGDLRAYIRRIMSIQGQRGSDSCFRVDCILRDEGLTPQEALEYMQDWNQRCAIPPWSVAELRKKVRDSFAKLERRAT